MTSDSSKVEDSSKLFEEIWPKLRGDMNAITGELKKQGYNVLALHPRYVILSQVEGKLGFVVTISDENAKELMKLLGSGLRYTVDLEFGLHKQLAVFVITLKNMAAKWSVLYPVYYSTNAEWLLRDLGGRGFYTFFRTQGGAIAGWVSMGSHQNYLYTRYQRGK